MIEVESYIEQQTSLLGKVCFHWRVMRRSDKVIVGVFENSAEAMESARDYDLKFPRVNDEVTGYDVDVLPKGREYRAQIGGKGKIKNKVHGMNDDCKHPRGYS